MHNGYLYFWNDFWNGVLAWGTLICVPDSRNSGKIFLERFLERRPSMGDFDLRSRFQKFGGLSLGASLWIWTWAPASKIQTPEFLESGTLVWLVRLLREILEKSIRNLKEIL